MTPQKLEAQELERELAAMTLRAEKAEKYNQNADRLMTECSNALVRKIEALEAALKDSMPRELWDGLLSHETEEAYGEAFYQASEWRDSLKGETNV